MSGTWKQSEGRVVNTDDKVGSCTAVILALGRWKKKDWEGYRSFLSNPPIQYEFLGYM